MNTRESLEKAYEAGRAAGILEMANREHVLAGLIPPMPPYATTVVNRNPANAPKATKAPIVARGVKKAPVARTKGVKEAIVKLLQAGYMTIDRIVAETGFKENSVRGTLMTMKKNGQAFQDGKNWAFVVDMHSVANGPAEGASAND